MSHYFSSAMRSTLPSPRLGRLFPGAWQSLLDRFFHPYRPELHYMRGPGPKWHAKHPDAA